MSLQNRVIQKFRRQKYTLAVAESCTGGLLSNILTNTPGSSDYFRQGIVAYANEAKQNLLKIPKKLLLNPKIGAVSYEIAEIMAQNIRKQAKTNYGIGITGIAGPAFPAGRPDGGSKQKPVGLVYIAVSSKDETVCCKCRFKGTRLSIKKQAAQTALELLEEFLS